ncbi:unnamed protein product [Triticum turgidum subsp. durum]|uniref:Protein kinase G11A n=1 Tax=Triticum turgidum subsp. durum TaxID=4567 RepID=A0A9R0QUW7_TRITD|nr:unnamed protein product [Triticum turgidum subsp. durum]
MQSSRPPPHAKPPRSAPGHARSRSQLAQVRPDPAQDFEFRFDFLPDAFRFDMDAGAKPAAPAAAKDKEEVLVAFDKVRLSIASSEGDDDDDDGAPPRSSFSGASHPPEPVDEMDPVLVAVDHGRGDKKAPPPPAKPVIVWDGPLGMGDFRLLRRLGCGDIGTVYLSELSKGGGGGGGAARAPWFAMKVMDKASLESRRKLSRAETEREILQLLDHPFLPTLYAHFETDKFACLVMEFCPGGDLHALRQRQPGKLFPEHAARFYAAEVLLALEYLHMLGVVYRDLKPENVLVRDDGHVMLSDFDLSLRCDASTTLVRPTLPCSASGPNGGACIQPTCFMPKLFGGRSKKSASAASRSKSGEQQQQGAMPELVVEPTGARSMSFVGTHEYLAPEIIKGEGHGSAVDWWTFGVFLHELMYGKTPFKGQTNRATLFNVVGQQLRFPEGGPPTSGASKDLIRGLLAKEPQGRLGVKRGAAEIKQHPFFEGVNWALIRCSTPPGVPRPVEPMAVAAMPAKSASMDRVETNYNSSKRVPAGPGADHVESGGKFLDFEFF